MAGNNETVARLIVQTAGQQGVDDLRNKVANVKNEIGVLNTAYAAGAVDVVEYSQKVAMLSDQESHLAALVSAAEAEIKSLNAAAGRSGEVLADMGIKLDNVAASAARAGTAVQGTGTNMSGLNQRMQAAGYAFQDFTATSGDLGAKLNSISNNIPNLLAGLGGLGTAVSVLATAGIAVYRNWRDIASLWEERSGIPTATHDLASMKQELDEVNKQVDKMRTLGALNATEMAKYNSLRSQSTEIEARYTAEKKAQDELAQAEAKRKAKVDQIVNQRSPEEQERAGNVMKAIGKEGEQLRTGLTKVAMDGEREDADAEHHAAYDKASKLPYAQRIAAQNKADKKFADRMEKAKKSTEAQVNRLLDDLSEGDEDAYKQLNTILDHHDDPLTFGVGLRTRIKAADPAKVKAKKDAEEKTKKDAEEKKKQDKLTDDLNEQGRENQRVGDKEQEKDDETRKKAVEKFADTANDALGLEAHEDEDHPVPPPAPTAKERKGVARRKPKEAPAPPKEAPAPPKEAPGGTRATTPAPIRKVSPKNQRRRKSAAKNAAKRNAHVVADPHSPQIEEGVMVDKVVEVKPTDSVEEIEKKTRKFKRAKEEAKKIEHVVGDSYSKQYEVAVANNQASLANGQGGVNPQQLEARLRAQIYNDLRHRGATPEGASAATNAIATKGNDDLTKRLVGVGNNGLNIQQATLNVASQLNQEVSQMAQRQNLIWQQIQQLRRDTSPETRGASRRGGR